MLDADKLLIVGLSSKGRDGPCDGTVTLCKGCLAQRRRMGVYGHPVGAVLLNNVIDDETDVIALCEDCDRPAGYNHVDEVGNG